MTASDTPRYPIGAAASMVGVSVGMLRQWETERLIAPARTESGRRLYSDADIARLKQIDRLRRFDGLNTAAIRKELGPASEPDQPQPSASGPGNRIRALRSERGLSLAQVSTSTGLSISFLSAVERGATSISVGNLIRIADLFQTSVPGLMQESTPAPHTVVKPANRPRFTGGNGLVTIEDMILGGGALEAYRYEIQPGGSSEGAYSHLGEEFLYVLSGSLDVVIDEEPYRLTTGDSLHLQSNHPHQWSNSSTELCVAIWVNLPIPPAPAGGGKGSGPIYTQTVWQRRSGKTGEAIDMPALEDPTTLTLAPGATNSIVDVPGIRVGHYTHPDVQRGITALLCERGATAGVSVRGANPGTLHTDALGAGSPWGDVHAIGLSGGSLFGLQAISGITEALARKGIGVQAGVARLPLVAGAVIYDLIYADPNIRPTVEWGIAAAEAASAEPFARGSVGAGAGATAGKGPGCVRTKGGLGTASLRLPGGIVVGAIVVVNSMGGLVHPLTGELYATSGGFDTPLLYQPVDWEEEARPDLTNTTIGAIATNAQLDKYQLIKVADLAHDGFARAIRPMHTNLDGDTIFALSTWDAPVTLPRTTGANLTDMIGATAADVMVLALLDAATQTPGVPNWPSAEEAGAMTARHPSP
jgi:L-aminopeptidase/D-esterase-like protein/DNA-binding transcriptional MerR regulator/quercetin dioxygenase-like cupin family protein